jgi:hypothetical protein
MCDHGFAPNDSSADGGTLDAVVRLGGGRDTLDGKLTRILPDVGWSGCRNLPELSSPVARGLGRCTAATALQRRS